MRVYEKLTVMVYSLISLVFISLFLSLISKSKVLQKGNKIGYFLFNYIQIQNIRHSVTIDFIQVEIVYNLSLL